MKITTKDTVLNLSQAKKVLGLSLTTPEMLQELVDQGYISDSNPDLAIDSPESISEANGLEAPLATWFSVFRDHIVKH